MPELKNTAHWDFVHSKASEANWTPGLREIFEYRDLGTKDGSKGDVVAHVIRPSGKDVPDGVQKWHVHECNFQMVYVLEGWGEFEFEGEGIKRLEKGDCILQKPMIRHREIACSKDYTVIEIVSPADFVTKIVDGPTGKGDTAK